MKQARDEAGRIEETVTDQDILKVFDYEADPVLTASEVAEGLRRFGKGITAEGVRQRLEQMAENGYVSRKKQGPRAVGWWAEVTPELDNETARTVEARTDSDDWSELLRGMPTVLVHPDVGKILQRPPNQIENRIRSKLADAGENPDRLLKPLKGREEYSLRIGKRRAIIDWQKPSDELQVLEVDGRV